MIKDIIEKCAAFDVYEKRETKDGYFEVVFFNKDAEVWNKALSDIMGPAAKLPGVKPSKEDSLLTKDHGGILANQILFKKKSCSSIVIAVFWPWRDGIHTTLKVVALIA